ncbi:hypothetical protein DAEQUDRAFT_262551 [Daedalea quercina L-15889]|uniref:Uncharacterized protein n=1 Tax=Daedalea quercina L-15889 TaxID=1314783 RepID=A0A165QEY6_9APHY|nr:hypothetical protein DAEQUDRAFT_262551 [Daedalea quercina L-15889]
MLTLQGGTLLVSLILWCIVSSLRVYAVSDRNKLITAVTILLGLLPFAINLWAEAHLSALIDPAGGFNLCATFYSNLSVTTLTRLVIISRSCAVASDTIVVLVVWYFIPSGFRGICVDSESVPLTSYLWANGTVNFA